MTHDFGNVKRRAEEELKRFVIMFAYLFVIFALFQLHEYLILRQHDIAYAHYGFAVIQALILAKVMLIGEAMKLGHRLSKQRRVVVIAYRSAVFALFFLVFKIFEDALIALFKGKNVIESITAPGGSTPATIILAVIFWVMLMPYFAFLELGRAYGVDSLKHLLLGAEDAPASAPDKAAFREV
jgi:hypothetical protein